MDDAIMMSLFLLLVLCSLIQTARDRLEYLFSLTEYYTEKGEFKSDIGRTFPGVLLDLANYKDDEIVQESLHLLNRYFSTEITLFQKAIQTQLLVTTESRSVFEQIQDLLPRLRRLAFVIILYWTLLYSYRNMSVDAYIVFLQEHER